MRHLLRRTPAVLLDPRARAALLGLLLAAMLVLVAVTGMPSPQQARDALATPTPWTPVIAVLGVAVLALLLFPRTAIAVVGGLIFGPWTATGYILLGTLLGATVAFGAGRLLGREYLAQLVGRRAGGRLARVDAWVARRALLAVITARLLPIVPFGLLNYGFGATRVRLATFLAGTAIGIAPSTLLYTVVGSAASDPTSPLFIGSTLLTALLAVAGVVIVGRVNRHRGTQ